MKWCSLLDAANPSMGKGSVELIVVLHQSCSQQYLSGVPFLIAGHTSPVTISSCCRSPLPNKLITSSAALQHESSITQLLRRSPLRVPSQKHSCGASSHNIKNICQPKKNTKNNVFSNNSYVCFLRPCYKLCTAPDHKSQHGKTCRMMLGRPILA